MTSPPFPGPPDIAVLGILFPAYGLGRHSQTTEVTNPTLSSTFSICSEQLTTHVAPPGSLVEEMGLHIKSSGLEFFLSSSVFLFWDCATKRKTMLCFQTGFKAAQT